MALVNIRNLSKNYGKGENEVKALKHVNLEINQGEFVALLGASGSGKSTLLNMIGGLDVVTEGEVVIDGYNIAKLSRKGAARRQTRFPNNVLYCHLPKTSICKIFRSRNLHLRQQIIQQILFGFANHTPFAAPEKLRPRKIGL